MIKQIGRKLVSDDKADKTLQNCQHEREIQAEDRNLRAMHTIGRMLMCKSNKMQTVQVFIENSL